MINRMTFNGVGQGLFYSGEINQNEPDNFVFVYDCGSTLRKKDYKFLDEAINTIPRHIDYLIISHLHEDHINGMRKLLDSRTVGRIFLPYFDVNTYTKAFAAYLIINGVIPSENDNSNYNLIQRLYRDESYKQGSIEVVKDDKKLKDHNWNFVFFNKIMPEKKIEELENKLGDLIGEMSIENYVMNKDNAIEKIKGVYADVFGTKQNLTSLILLHYPDNGKQTLLTGDVIMDEELEVRIKKYMANDYILQVPHHGGKDNWLSMSEQLWSNADGLVFSYGLTNRYNHPSTVCFQEISRVNYSSGNVHYVYEGNSYVYSIVT